jgi:uncharacterized membrane protein (DUF485 family)
MRSSRSTSQTDPAGPRQRTGLGAILSVLVALGYYGFLLAGAYVPQLLASPAVGHVPWSFLLGALLLVFIVAMTGLYTVLANASETRR